MPRDLILGTAGHIDHGKTALVKALTGIDCDRLPEEKKRGITIDIGFAHLDLGDPGAFKLGIIDVPGHERFIRNMLAGATSIDLALLVVSAGESIKPQTREHLEILRLLGLRRGVVALTKADLVDETTLEVVENEVRDLVKGSFLEEAPIVAVSAYSGRGIDELKQALRDACAQVVEKHASEWFRLAIDRSFTAPGYGTVVTGSVTSGRLKVGAEIEWLPRRELVRVRGLHNHDTPVEEVLRGQRAAINLAAVPHEEIRRGQELATPGYLVPSKALTVRLHPLADLRRPMKHRAEVRLHLGTAETMATVSLLEGDSIEPGAWGLAQLFLDDPLTAIWGQPFVVRDSSAEHTLGGGQVLQPVAAKMRRRHLEMLERVQQLGAEAPEIRAGAAAWFGGFGGLPTADLVRGAGIEPTLAPATFEKLVLEGKLVNLDAAAHKALLHVDRFHELEERLLNVLGRLHIEEPLHTSHDRQKLVKKLEYVGDDSVVQAAIDRLIKTKRFVGDGKRVARADFKPKLSANQRKLKDKIVEAHRAAGFQPPGPESFAAQAGGNATALKDIYEVAVAEELLVRIDGQVFLHAAAEAEMRQRVADQLARQPAGLTVAEIRDLLATTRKFAVPLCEYLDRVGVTRRLGDLRVIADRRAINDGK
jgi:selenocysteine-specific elongation factor